MTPSGRSPVEELIAALHAGEVEPDLFAKRLIDQSVFMPVKDDKHRIGGFQTSTRAEPLVVDDQEGNRVLVLFSAPERAKAFVTAYPGFGGGLVTEFAWVLRRMGTGIGIAIDPGEESGMDFDPEMVAMLASLLPEEAS